MMDDHGLHEVVRRNVTTDTPFRRRMRLHQAWWRAKQGYGFGRDSAGELGSLLSPEDAEAGRNFLTAGIAELARRPAGRHIEPRRLTTNLLSSQPMAFNLFGPLSIQPDLARTLLEPMVGESLFVASVELEFAPDNKAAHLNDETSFDALIRYVTQDGASGLIAVETKLSESFSPVTATTNADRPIYREVSVKSGRYVDPHTPALATSECWQMWRNHLLAEKYSENSCPPGTRVQSWVIRHQDDYNGASSVAKYRECLAEPEQHFREWTLQEIADLWSTHVPQDHAGWLAAFRERYVDLSGSAELAAAIPRST